MRHGRFLLALLFVLLCGWFISSAQPPKKNPPPPAEKETEEPSADELKEKAIAERFQKVLETNPRRGTALDRLYGYHVERGTLDKLIGTYTARTKANPKDGTAWMIAGMLESQRGKDAAAVAAFRRAEENLLANAMPGYYLGQSLVLVGQPDAAAEAFERAITKKPNRNDLLDIFQALGRVYQRAQRTDKALDVWNRLEKLYPDDARVQEQIATTLIEEGQFGQALPRLEKLAAATDDKYRQSTYRIEAAELKVRLKKTAEALADFEKILAELNPDSWLHRDVRRRVEDVFLRSDDLAGLAKYYEKWLEKNPADVDAFARLAKNLASQGRAPEAKQWLEKGLQAAPSNRALRQGLIDQLAFEQNFAAAAQQYEALDKADPNNPDTLREWGKMLMRDAAKPEPERRAAAAAVWKRILEKKPNDPVATAQVADLMRSAGATDDAVALYKKAIDLAPDAAQYREYLGEYYHSLKRSAEALATWRPIAEGKNRSAANLTRLAEVFAGFGYRKEAIEAMKDAVALERDDFGLLMTYAQLLHEDGQNDLALTQISAASKRTSNPEEVEQILLAEIKVYQATEKLVEQIAALEKALGADAPADRWLRLARFYEANRQLDKASEAIGTASAKDAKSVPVSIAAARIYESAGNMLAAADTNRKLAALDRRYRTEYLQAVAKLEQRLGRRDLALQAGRDVLASAPGNPEVYKFYADLCFQLGDQEEGLESLRRSVRANPSDPAGLMTLANALAERTRQGEAIELLWRAFDKTNELEGKLGVVDRITQLYLENNQFDRLMERLERERRESDKAREMAMCIAQAYSTAGDLGTARTQLEKLLTENTRDVNLLTQLVSLCESEGDVAAAVKYQRQINTAAPNNYDHKLKLAQLLTRSGESDEAADIWVKLVAGETEPHRNLASIDQLLGAKKEDAALAILSRMLAQKPGNWELLYREGATLFARGKHDEAAVRFNAILALKLPDDELSDITKNQINQAKKKAGAAPRPGQPAAFVPRQYDENARPPFMRRMNSVYRIRELTGAEVRYYGSGYTPPHYSPSDFGEARMACLAFLLESAKAKGAGDAFLKRLREARDKAGADPRPVWDWLYLLTVRNDYKDRVATAFALTKGPDPAGLLAYLNAVTSRTYGQPSRRASRGAEPKDTTPPLPADQLAQVLACYQKLKQLKPEWVTSDVTQTVLTELKRANRPDDETTIYKGVLAGATTVPKLQEAIQLACTRKDTGTALDLFVRLDKLQGAAKTAAALAQLPTRQATSSLEQLAANLGDEKLFTELLKVLDLTLTTARRQNLSVPPSTVRRSSQGGGLSGYIPGKPGKNYSVSYPSANEYYDFQLLHLMYTAFDKFKTADLASDLFAHVRKQADAAQGAERMYLMLAVGYLHWWNEEKDEALAALAQALALVPADHNLVLEVASLREQNAEPEVALALLDSIAPLDTRMMQLREDAAMRLAERTGNVERARQAAERLFGLRLDADKQLELAGKMHRLGMSQLAETVLNRAQRQAGNKTNTLLRLMTQYQSQNQTDLAVQIARQLLRNGPSANFNPRRGYDETDQARNQAIGVLARSGKLKEMIERAEAQLKSSPKSVQMRQALLGYYQAAGDKEKVKATLKAMAELKPDDGKLRFQVAQQLQQAGDREGAIQEYKQALKLDPSSFGNRYWEIQNLFAQLNKYEELGQLFDEIDVRKVGSYWSVFEIVSSLLQNDKTKELGLKLFKKSWDTFPLYRGELLSRLYDDSVWRLPEIYTYAKEAVIPREDSEADAWQSATQILSYGGDGRVDGVVTRMLGIARKQQQLSELKDEVKAAIAKRPDWAGGKALLAVIEIQTGNKEAGKKLWQETFADPKTDVPPVARFILCQELEFYAGVEEMAVRTLEAGFDDMMKDGNYEYSINPARRLIWWYEHLGRDADAKKIKLRFAKDEQIDPGYSGGYWQYRQVQNKLSVAGELQKSGDVIEAVRLYNQLLADKDSLLMANQYSGGEQFDQQVEGALRNALKSLKPATLPAAVGTLLTPLEVTASNKSALDLVVIFESRDLSKAALTSVFASAIKSTEKAPEIRKEAAEKLAELAKKHPNDFSVHTAAALIAFADGKPEGIREAVDRLVKLAEATPLEALPSGKANSRQRAEALPQVLLWLVARECLSKEKDREPYRGAGEKLAARAVAAAKRQQDPFSAMAILREWGQLELDRGDKAKAEARWAEILEMSLPKANPAKVGAAPGGPAPTPAVVPATPVAPAPAAPAPEEENAVFLSAQPPAVAAPAAKGPAAKGPPAPRGAPVLTTDQFQQVYEVAALAADKGLADLSLKAIRDAVRGGPPVPGKQNPNMRGGGRLISRVIGGTQYYVEGGQAPQIGVDQALVELVPKWKALKVPPAEIYDAVVGAVLPAARPAEVFLYSDGRLYGTIYTLSSGGYLTPTTDAPEEAGEDRGLSGLLCGLAVDAGKVDDLRAKLQSRVGQPLGELPAQILLASLAVRAKDDARTVEALKTLGARIQKDSLQSTNDRVTGVLVPALSEPKFAAVVFPFIERAAENYATGNNLQRAAELRIKLARWHLDRKNEAGARAQFAKVVERQGAVTRAGQEGFNAHNMLATEYLKAGWLEDALRELGLHADRITAAGADPRVRARRAEPTVEQFPRLVRLLLDVPAAKRYELLKAWSLPTEGRKSVRYYVGTMPEHVPPPAFGKFEALPAGRVVSTMLMLADAAKEAGKSDELTAAAEKLAADKVESADLFLVLVKLAHGKGKESEALVKAFAAAANKRMTDKPEASAGPRYYDPDFEDGRGQAPLHPSEFLFASLCLADPALLPHGEGLLKPLLDRAQGTQRADYIHRIRSRLDKLGATRAGAPDALADGLPSRWTSITPGAVWFAQDGYLVRGWGEQSSFLLFDTPLAGTFEFSVDVFQGGWTEGHAGYAGVMYEPNRPGVSSAVWALGHQDQVYRNAQNLHSDQFNRLTFQVSPGKVRCLLNSQLFYEDTDAPATSPWLMLYAGGGRRPVFRNPVLTGKPEVPTEVKLSAGDALGGWLPTPYGGTAPNRMLKREQATGQSVDRWGNPVTQNPNQKEPNYDWQAKGGEILGRKLEKAENPVPSRLAYFRPLQPGEALRYEFFYEPGKAHTHPSLGHLAFLLEPDGVKLHWLTAGGAEDWSGLPADNAVAGPAATGAKPALKANDWNAVTLSTAADGVKIELNGAVVFVGALPANLEREFGLFHFRDKTAVRVRNVVLTGPWAKEAPAAIDFATKPASPAVAKARRGQLGEKYYATEAGDVVRKAQKLPPAERYKVLADWVLPTESRPAFQLAGADKPLDVLGVVDRTEQPAGRRVALGSEFEAPCLEMIAAAKEAGALDALGERIAKAENPTADDLFRRSKLALLAAVRAAQGRDGDAADALKQLIELVKKMPPDANPTERWPDLIAVYGTLDRAAQIKAVGDLAHETNLNLEQSFLKNQPFDTRDWWTRAYRSARARAQVAGQPEGVRRAFGSDPGLAHWAAVPSASSWTRSQGWNAPHWSSANGTVTHFPGHSEDYLMLRTPLRGDFEVTCDLRVQGWSEAHVRYGAHQFDLAHDRKKYKLHTMIRPDGRDVTINPPLPAAKTDVYTFKLVVRDGWLRAFVDDREVVAEKIGTTPEPWLVLHCHHQNTGTLTNVKINGTPTVPEKIDPLANDDLGFWQAHLGNVASGATRNYAGNFWVKRGEELYEYGKMPDPPEEGKPAPTRYFPESALYYQRPVLEDGAVEYEFFYDPGKSLVHPMLDRLTFLLEPGGVKLHWLTDGPHEKSGIAFDNAKDEPANRRGPEKLPLKEKAWNKVRLAVKGDTVSVTLNGTEVYERAIESTNQRFFGLFHYTDRTEVRVRSMTYAGDWGKALPAADKLFEKK